MKCSISGKSNTACGRGGERAHVPLPAANEAEPKNVSKDEATPLCAAVVKSGVKAREGDFGGMNLSNDCEGVSGDELGAAHGHSADMEAFV